MIMFGWIIKTASFRAYQILAPSKNIGKAPQI